MPKTFAKDGREVLVFSPTHEVNLRAQGWHEVFPIGEKGPEVFIPVATEAEPTEPEPSTE